MYSNPNVPQEQTGRNKLFAKLRAEGKSYDQIAFDYLEKTGIRLTSERIRQLVNREIKRAEELKGGEQ